jgi:hypothetical protein
MKLGMTRWKVELLNPNPLSPVQRARKFSVVFGTTSERSCNQKDTNLGKGHITFIKFNHDSVNSPDEVLNPICVVSPQGGDGGLSNFVIETKIKLQQGALPR